MSDNKEEALDEAMDMIECLLNNQNRTLTDAKRIVVRSVNSVCYSPDGKYIVPGSRDNIEVNIYLVMCDVGEVIYYCSW